MRVILFIILALPLVAWGSFSVFHHYDRTRLATQENKQTVEQPSPPRTAIALSPEQAAKLQEMAFDAARQGDAQTLQEYFAAGRPVNDVNARGDTLLTVAAYSGQPAAVDVILAQPSVAVDVRNKMGLTALTAAAFKGHIEIAQQLVKAGADVNAANKSGQTALMFAALTGRKAMVEYLVSVGADVRAADRRGNTALSLAKSQGADELVTLLEAPAQPRK